MTACEDVLSKYNQVQNAITELSSAIAGLDIPSVEGINAKINALESEVSSLKGEVRQAKNQSSSAQRGAQKALTEIFALGGVVSVLKGDVGNISGGISRLKTDTQSLFRSVGDLKGNISYIGQTANGASQLAKRVESDLGGVKSRAFEAFDRAGLADRRAQGALKETSHLGGKVSSIFGIIAGLATLAALAALQAQINSTRSIANEGRDTARHALSHSGEVEKALRSFEEYIKNRLFNLEKFFKAKIAELNKKFGKEIDRVLGIVDSKFEELNSKIERVASSISKLRAELLGVINSEIQKILSKIQQLNQLIQKIESSLKEYINSEIQKILSKIQQLNQLIQKIESSLKEYINSEIQKILSKIQQLNQLIQRIESSLKEYINSEIQKVLLKIEKFNQLIRQIESSLKEFFTSKLESLKNFLQAQIPLIIAAAAAIALAQLLAKLPNLIKQNTPQMTCRFNDVAAREAATTAKRHEQKFNIFQSFVQLTMWADIKNSFKGTFDRLGAILPNGGIAGKIGRMAKSSLWDKAMGALNTWILLHNAFMLSSSLMQTLGETLSTGLSVIGIKDDDDNPIDINRVLGKAADDLISSIIGAAQWTELKQTLAAANRIYQSASNIIFTLRSISDSNLAIGQWTAEQLAKIGNGLKADGLVSKLAYPWMPETVLPQNAILQRLENLDDAASSLNMVVNEVKSIQDEAAELANQKEEFGKEIDKFKKQKEDLAKAWDDDSESPDIPVDKLTKPEGD